MSCAIPGVFMPVCVDKECYIDGGVRANYPLSYCLEQHDKEEVLGINYRLRESITSEINEESSILEFILGFSINAMMFITKNMKVDKIPYEIVCEVSESPLSLSYVKRTLNSSEKRRLLLEEGFKLGTLFLEKIQQENKV